MICRIQSLIRPAERYLDLLVSNAELTILRPRSDPGRLQREQYGNVGVKLNEPNRSAMDGLGIYHSIPPVQPSDYCDGTSSRAGQSEKQMVAGAADGAVRALVVSRL